ncbi:MAG: ABC transporter permease, partial [Candidatus Latescibacteria bacterium]|nr:ABC transporter permease [Candidatus Latescibacterota bacterium]
MLRHYLKLALRNLMRQKVYSFINVFGLALGIACCLLIGLYVQHHLNYDRFHEKGDRIFQVNRSGKNDEGIQTFSAITATALAVHMKEEWPEIEHAVRVFTFGSRLLKNGEKRLSSSNVYYVDSAFLDVFSFPLMEGDPQTALKTPFSIVLTEKMAKRAFGEENPIGKTLQYDNKFDLTVTGVVKDTPTNSHMQFNYLVPFELLKAVWEQPNILQDKVNISFFTYLLLHEGVNPQTLVDKYPALFQKYWKKETSAKLILKPITELHLDTETEHSFGPKADRRYIYTFATVAVLILLTACVNFMNLATARSARRAKEVGLRKVLGAYRLQLIRQFLGEAILLAVCMAVALSELLLPFFNDLSGMNLTFEDYHGWHLAVILLLSGLVVGVVSGSYPAFFLSKFYPIAVLKGEAGVSNWSGIFRRVLIVFQFAVTTGLIAGTLIVLAQFDFMRSQPLGFDRDHVMYVYANRDIRKHYDAFKQALLQHSNIISVAQLNNVPGTGRPTQGYRFEGKKGTGMATMVGDSDLLPTLGFELVAGRNFSPDHASDSTLSYILNEAAVRKLEWEDPIGKSMRVWEREDWGT